MNMRITILAVLAFPLLLAGCPDGKVTPAETVLTACQTYTAAFATANGLDKQGKLSEKAQNAVTKAIGIADPLCGGPAPKFDGSILDTVSVNSATDMINAAIGE